MCPPGKVVYFFTIDKIATFAKDHMKQTHKIPKSVEHVEQYDEIKNYKIHKFNFRVVEQGTVLDEHYFSLLKSCIPRPELKKYVKPEIEETRDPWEFEKSLFYPYCQDNQDTMNK